MTDYRVIYETADDGTVAAYAPGLPVFSTGVDRADAQASIREAIELYVETLVEDGDEVPVPDISDGVVTVSTAR